jgi:nitrous oxidase accessory protein NosD
LGTDVNKAEALLLVLVLTFSFCLLVPAHVKAAARTIVVPDDYPTIQAAINSANSEDTVFVKKGTYELAEGQLLVIDKSISLCGEDADDTTIIVHPSLVQQNLNDEFPEYGYENPIEVQASNVTISGFTITSDGGSIVTTTNMLQLINNKINAKVNVYGCYENIVNNSVAEGVVCYGSFNNIEKNQISGYGLFIGSSSSSNTIHKNIIVNCLGISIIDYSASSVTGNRIFSNTVKNCTIGLEISLKGSSSNNTAYHNNFINAGAVIARAPWSFDNGKEGNFWSDYTGNDTNNDGIGDTPYSINQVQQDNYPLMFPFDVENDSVVVPTVEPANSDSACGTTFSTLPIIAVSVVVVAVVAVAAVIYLKKRKR